MSNQPHKTLTQALATVVESGAHHHLTKLQRGLEKESLRVDANGVLAQTPHPTALGATLTHPSITTDYSESLLEFVTGVHENIGDLLQELHDLHHFTYHHIGDEKLWVNSMPCIVEGEEKIPIARYGRANIAQMKEIYRRGLSHRYGALMQTIAGIHFNFSLPTEFWCAYLSSQSPASAATSAHYFALIRNFHRHSWLTTYCCGASPAVCRSFLAARQHTLQALGVHSFYAPDATSLRLSRLGYSNEVQADIAINYDGIEPFVQSLRRAIQTEHPAYRQFGVKVADSYQQLNANLLQIENEFYSSIRPKRVAASGQSPARALAESGVQYIEVRSIDLNPFTSLGIDADTIRLYDLFLLFCLFAPSPPMTRAEFLQTQHNQQTIVMHGRAPRTAITTPEGTIQVRTALMHLLDQLQAIAELLDQVHGGIAYATVLQQQRAKAQHVDQTPSARILAQMTEQSLSFYEFANEAADAIEQDFKQKPLPAAVQKKYQHLATTSHHARQQIETDDCLSFDAYLEDYFRRQNQP